MGEVRFHIEYVALYKEEGAVCLDYTFSGRGCLQGSVALTHQPKYPLCSFSFEIVGDVGCSCEIV